MTCIVPATMIAEILDSVPAQQDREARIRGVGRQKRISSSGTAHLELFDLKKERQ